VAFATISEQRPKAKRLKRAAASAQAFLDPCKEILKM
jgi:hypothetical protein